MNELTAATQIAINRWMSLASGNPAPHGFLASLAGEEKPGFCGFLFDPNTHPLAIQLAQSYVHSVWPTLMFLSRSWLWEHHSARYKLLGLINFLICSSLLTFNHINNVS